MGIVFSECSGLNDDLWKVEGQIVKSFLQDTDTEKNKYDDFVNAVFNVKKSKKFAEKSSGLTEFESGKIVDEGENGVQDEIQQGFSKMIEHVQFIKTFACTANMREDGDIDAMKTAAKNFDMSYKRTRCEMGSSALTTEGATYIYGGRTGLDKTTGDGLGLFNTAHVAKKSGVATQSNVFTNAFGTTSAMLNRLQNIGRNYKNDSGIVMGNDGSI